MKNFIATIICIMICQVCCYSQKRVTIDRTVKSEKRSHPLSSSTIKSDVEAGGGEKTGKGKTKENTPNSSSTRKKSQIVTSSNQKKSSSRTSKQGVFSISSQYERFDADGGSRIFTVSSSSSWKVSVSPASWAHLSRNGNTLYLKVDPNNSSSSRSDYFTISSGARNIIVDISQAKANNSLAVSSESLSFPSAGGRRTIIVNSSSSWNIGTKTYNWGHLSINGDVVTVRVDANNSSDSRTDYFTIRSGDFEKTVNIFQSGSTDSSSKYATIKSVQVCNDADVDGNKGLSVKVSFSVLGMKGHSGQVACCFYDSNGKALINANNAYGTAENPSKVAVHRDIIVKKKWFENLPNGN